MTERPAHHRRGAGRRQPELDHSWTWRPLLRVGYQLIERFAHQNREHIPERTVHTKGWNALGKAVMITSDIAGRDHAVARLARSRLGTALASLGREVWLHGPGREGPRSRALPPGAERLKDAAAEDHGPLGATWAAFCFACFPWRFPWRFLGSNCFPLSY